MSSAPTINLLRDLFHHRWSAPVLAELHRGAGAKFITLARRLNVGHDSLRRTLTVLVERGWVARNAGYGHPLRPEYVLTSSAAALAERCLSLQTALGRLGVPNSTLGKWSLPITYAVGQGCQRFSQLRAYLSDVTPRALSLTLKGLEPPDLIQRRIEGDHPPTSLYDLTSRGRELLPVLAAF